MGDHLIDYLRVARLVGVPEIVVPDGGKIQTADEQEKR
jgi:hypothetical protein